MQVLMYRVLSFRSYILCFNWKLVRFPLHLLYKSWTKIWSRDPLYKVKGIEVLYNNTVWRVWQTILICKFYLSYLPIFFKSLEKFLNDPLLTFLLLYNSEISVQKIVSHFSWKHTATRYILALFKIGFKSFNASLPCSFNDP